MNPFIFQEITIKMTPMKERLLKYAITGALVALGTFCLLKSYGYCEYYALPIDQEYRFEHYECRNNWDANNGRPNSPKKPSIKQNYQQEFDYHMFHAKRCYEDAYNRVWWLPNLSWRQIGRDAWVAACATTGGNTITSRLVIAFSAMLSSYGLTCLDEWDYIQDKLKWSQYHFEQCEYYARMMQ